MPIGIPMGARCVQRFDDSLNSAIHITYRISLRSSSMREPRDPFLKVVMFNYIGASASQMTFKVNFGACKARRRALSTHRPYGAHVCGLWMEGAERTRDTASPPVLSQHSAAPVLIH